MARREVVSLPSASTLALIRHETAGRKLAPKRVAVIGDPVYDSQDARLGKYSSAIGRRSGDEVKEKSEGVTYAKTAFFQSEAFSDDSNEIGSSGGNLRFPRLSFTRQEAADIASLADSKDVMLAMDFRANRETAMGAQMAQYQIVHLAAHGLLNTQFPDRSAVVLSLVDEEGRPRNGFLRLQDIYDLNLPAELVVLSACETALGKTHQRRRSGGLTRGFMYAGSKRVMASLWKVADQATAELMKVFYKAILEKGQSATEALRTAQMALRNSPKWRAPFFWAPFILQGEYN